jgi:hypothetical protein
MKLRTVWGFPVAEPYHKRPAFAGDPAILSLHSGKYDLPATSTYPGCGGRIGARLPARAIDRGERACRSDTSSTLDSATRAALDKALDEGFAASGGVTQSCRSGDRRTDDTGPPSPDRQHHKDVHRHDRSAVGE